MAGQHYANPSEKETELRGIIGRDVEMRCARNGHVEEYKTRVYDVEPFWWIEIFVPAEGIAKVLQDTAQRSGQLSGVTERRMFLGEHSAIQQLKLDDKIVYECPFIPDNYDEADIHKVLATREQMFGAEYDAEYRKEHTT